MKNSFDSKLAMADCMESVSYENETQWSVVYDKENLTMDFYNKRKFLSPLSFDFK